MSQIARCPETPDHTRRDIVPVEFLPTPDLRPTRSTYAPRLRTSGTVHIAQDIVKTMQDLHFLESLQS